jgi:hypothetical protein
MISRELSHGFGLEGCQTTATRFEGIRIILEVESKKALLSDMQQQEWGAPC